MSSTFTIISPLLLDLKEFNKLLNKFRLRNGLQQWYFHKQLESVLAEYLGVH